MKYFIGEKPVRIRLGTRVAELLKRFHIWNDYSETTWSEMSDKTWGEAMFVFGEE